MSLSDDVRRHCKLNYIEPAKAKGQKYVTIRAGDVHTALGYRNRYPLVCSAIGTNLFQDLANVRRISIEGPVNGANTKFKFELL